MNLLKNDASNAEIIATCRKLRLSPMAEVICEMSKDPSYQPSYREVSVKLINAVITARRNNNLQKALRELNLAYPDACINDFYANHSGLALTTAKELCSCEWIYQHRNMLISGGTFSGKTWIGDMLAVSAALKGLKIYRRSMFELILNFRTLGLSATSDLITELLRYDLIYLDGFGQQPLLAEDSAALQMLIEKAIGRSSVLMTTILNEKGWADVFMEQQSSINNFESIYSRMTANPSININLRNSYYKQAAAGNASNCAPNADYGNSASDQDEQTGKSFHFTPSKQASASIKRNIDFSDIKANSADFMKKKKQG